jgi:hypothetical protein
MAWLVDHIPGLILVGYSLAMTVSGMASQPA